MKNESLRQYITELNTQYKTGNAREHSYRPALKDLLDALLPQMVVTNEPAHFECGAPDYIISRKKDHLPVFFVEAKDINDNDLDGRNKSGHKEQFDRYKQALDYIIFTDYLDFHLYEHGNFVDSVRIAELKGDRIVEINDAEDKLIGIIQHLGKSAIQRITSAPRLAKLMAGKARLLASIIEEAMNDKSQSYENDNLRGQYQAFKDVLIQELKKEDFADIYAQTIAYGLFAARLHDDTPENFSREEAARLIPKTNPFLRQIFNNLAGNDLDERIAWVVDDLVTVFQATNIQKIMKTYVQDKRHHDPMIHFYEDFLSEYNPKLRKSKGVWYTPQPVVGFIVRAVDEILQKDFGLSEGLADYSMIEQEVAVEQSRDRRTSSGMRHEKRRFHRVQILDPATGTGTFLAEVVNQIYDRYRDNQGIWQEYVEKHLLPRLNGFEILMASYAVAHIKLDMLLSETGYQHTSDKRLHVYLTNSLEESNNEPRTLFAQWLSREATEANVIKRDCPVMVMIGNPPYSVSSQNNGLWILDLLNKYKEGLNERKININDDYIKFIALAQDYIQRNGEGIVGFITNNSYIDGITHRHMRLSLMNTFDKLFILNLHGNSKKRETTPNGGKDENVFDIMQGVCINIFVKTKNDQQDKQPVILYQEIYGKRERKYEYLNKNSIKDIGWIKLNPVKPYYFFSPKDFARETEYKKGFGINELFVIGSTGIESQKDSFCLCNSTEVLRTHLNDLINTDASVLREKYQLGPDGRNWKVSTAKEAVGDHIEDEKIVEVAVSPFDTKFTYLTVQSNGFLAWPRIHSMQHMLIPSNFSIIIPRQTAQEWRHVAVEKRITNGNFLASAKLLGSGVQYPLFIKVGFADSIFGKSEKIKPNFNEEEIQKIEQSLGEHIEPIELFDYIYAVLHSPTYRERYKEFLKIDFPRIPYPKNREQFRDLAEKGKELRLLHLMEDLPNSIGVSFPQRGSMQVDVYRWEDNRVYINSEQYFEGVPESAWNFFIGGYQPAQKWLKDRKGTTLNFEDVRHYQHIIYVLQQTEQLMTEIDQKYVITE